MNIRVNLNTNIADGSEVVFRSPADCSQVTGLVIYHTGGKTEFAFADAHGNNVGDIDHLFAENAVVKVILDVTAGMAFVQNADTNAYIERTFVKSVNGQSPDEKGNVEVKTPEGGNGTPGNDGKDGGYYVPTVEQVNEAEVEISFTSLGGENMPQVEPVKLFLPRGADGKKGDKGDKGDQGERGPKGDTGASGPQGESGAKGDQGIPGEKGEKGDPGIPGNDGAPGADGKDGHTPVKGVDYYTEEEKAEFEAYIASELARRGQLKPEFANSVEECTDTTKLYVLPDNFIYAYIMTEVMEGGYTNVVDVASSDFHKDSRINANCAVSSTTVQGAFVSNTFDCKPGDILRIKGITGTDSSSATAPGFVVARLKADGTNLTNANNAAFLKQHLGVDQTELQRCWDAVTTDENGVMTWTYAMNNSGANFATAHGEGAAKARIAGIATNGIENVIVTVNEEIVEASVVKQYTWANTGHAFISADYEDRIFNLEVETAKINEAIDDLQDQIDSGAASTKSNARWFALGDSITEGWTSAVDASNDSGYKQFLNTNTEERWANIVANKNGYDLTNHGIGGTGYLQTKQTTMNARQLADTLDFSQCDFVTLAYGVNDWKYAVNIGSMDDDIDTGGSMVANMRYVIKKILTDNPLCKIFVITPINCKSLGSYDTNWGIHYKGSASNGLGLEDIFQLQKAVCDYHGIELIDMTHSSIVNRENIRSLLADSVHPTVEGHLLMARELSAKINFK